MPSNSGYYRRKTRKEEALVRREANLAAYQAAEDKMVAPDATRPTRTIATKLKIVEAEVVALKHNIQMPKRGRAW